MKFSQFLNLWQQVQSNKQMSIKNTENGEDEG